MSCSASPSSRFRMSLFQLMQLCRKGVWLGGDGHKGSEEQDRRVGGQRWGEGWGQKDRWEGKDKRGQGQRDRKTKTGTKGLGNSDREMGR